ncbi:MAG: hypothetical protein ABFS19_12720 [Thermodesulfobacteriota bacterium]
MNSKRAPLKMSSIVKKLIIALSALSLLSLSGCATRQNFARVDVAADVQRDVLADKPAELRPDYQKLMEEGERNAVLNQMQIGLKARQYGYTELSNHAFDQAILGIEQVFGPGQQKADIRSLWIEEGAKIFKGEPYERAMAFYYRGLSYFEQGDYGNARAAFRSGQLQDAFAEDDQKRCDFALLMYLDGFASLADNDRGLADESYREFSGYRTVIQPPYEHNTLVIVETGRSPRKVADGSGHSELKFRRGRDFREVFAEVCIDDQPCRLLKPIEDIFWQSSTRGGRQVDRIVGRKAQFRTSAVNSGSAVTDLANDALIFAPLFDNVAGAQAIGGGLSLIGVTAMAIGQMAKPHADTRYWNNLPDTVHVYSTNLAPGTHTFKIGYRTKNNKLLKKLKSEKSMVIDGNRRNLVWIKSQK